MTGKEAVRRAAPAWLPAGVAAGFLVLVWAAGGGPVDLFDPSDRTRGPRVYPSAGESPVEGPSGPPQLAEATEDVEQTLDLSWLGDLIAWAIFLGTLVAVAALARMLWQRRWRPPPPAPVVEFEVLPAREIADRLTEDAQAQREAIAEGEPRNGIVRCWLLLQDSIAAAGLPPGPAETSTEFTVRVLHALDLDPRAIERLARLYREARFSHHPLGEDARAEAAAALDALHADLAKVSAP